MNLYPHRVSFLLPWGQTAFPGQRGKLRTGLEARGTTGMSLGISQSTKTQNAYTCPEIFHLWFVFSGFTSDKCSETPTCSSKKVLQDSNFAKVKITSASFSLPFNPYQSPFLPHEQAWVQSTEPPMAGYRVQVSISGLNPFIFSQTSSLSRISTLQLTRRQRVGSPGL